MKKLRRAVFVSCSFAAVSMLFLFTSYVHSAVAQEPKVGAATTEQREEIVEIIVVEQHLLTEFVQEEILEIDSSDEIEGEIFAEEKLLEKEEGKEKVGFEKSPKPEIQEKKIVEITKTAENKQVETKAITLRGIESEIHERSNASRERRGKDELIFDEKLSNFARERSQDMHDRNYFAHTAPSGCGIVCNFESSDYETLVWAENIARYNPYDEASMEVVAEIFVEKWLKSSGHRDNLLSQDYTHHGIGVAVEGKNIIATVIFARPIQKHHEES
jgi:uncharacterized protein YkwD